ncbi:restriction endonuclease subunit S [Anaeromicropila herbilytica]|uniref:Type I restriction modification DNA specificity domain-containing protein n=1 Tax=Anaeromicropila herbilytica TaxID=2785025 RepID=A0A7R7EMU5_9FIRM|nr:restriction endonuclease subunit S [Anaeromicropila herbilytica]BCN31855.1 hypothetical protein bsdtb5_31500 [Anaeromicropila herbilytica]
MEIIKLGDLCDLQNGYAFKSDDYIDSSETLNCRMSNIRPDGTFDILYSAKYLPDEYAEIYEDYLLRDGDLIIAMTDMAGDPKILGVPTVVDTKGYNLLLNQRVGKLKLLKEVDTRYLKFALLCNQSRQYLKRFASGGVQLNVSKKDILCTPILFRGLTEQVKMSDTLEKVLRIISLRKKQLFELDELIKSRFIEMFGDPVENTMNWKVCKLGDLSDQINSGNTPKGGEQVYVDKGITFFRSQNVWKDRLEMDDIAFIDKETHENMKRSSLMHGDILITKTGRINTENSSLGRAALYLGEDDAANVNGHVYFIRLKPGVNNEFILKILVSNEYLGYIRSVCVGGIDKRQLNKNHIEDFPIICPPKDMQNKFIDFAHQVDKLKFVS